MAYNTILLDIADGVATITLNRPDRLNAASLEMTDEIVDALDELGDARCVVITGSGKGFCSGADLQAMAGSADSISGGAGSYRALVRHFNPMMMKLARLPMPVITAVNGAAAGIGCSIGLAGDFVFSGRKGYFLQAFVNIGLVPDGGASWVLPRLVGKQRATQMMMLGEKVYGEQAEDWGLIYKCVDDDQLQAEARALAIRLASGPTAAYATMRRNILVGMENSYAEQLLAEAEGQLYAGDTQDAAEGALSFIEKRTARFQGK